MTHDEATAKVDAIFEDLRDRRFLKWLFCKHPDQAGAILIDQHGAPLMPLDADVQNEIRASWVSILTDKK